MPGIGEDRASAIPAVLVLRICSANCWSGVPSGRVPSGRLCDCFCGYSCCKGDFGRIGVCFVGMARMLPPDVCVHVLVQVVPERCPYFGEVWVIENDYGFGFQLRSVIGDI
ncbi:unnamed protein product [Clonostachys solani]|uniref:Uncharacterized protein n=1 Tax=Clonostachys solani TaxID=160281 RepID=A0A9P0EJJ2_9HYPO|nr:unnamed protein product [Clonostachys solani]